MKFDCNTDPASGSSPKFNANLLTWFPHFFTYKIQGLFKYFSRTSQYFFKDLFCALCMLKKWVTDYKNKFRLEGMKNGNF